VDLLPFLVILLFVRRQLAVVPNRPSPYRPNPFPDTKQRRDPQRCVFTHWYLHVALMTCPSMPAAGRPTAPICCCARVFDGVLACELHDADLVFFPPTHWPTAAERLGLPAPCSFTFARRCSKSVWFARRCSQIVKTCMVCSAMFTKACGGNSQLCLLVLVFPTPSSSSTLVLHSACGQHPPLPRNSWGLTFHAHPIAYRHCRMAVLPPVLPSRPTAPMNR
jgi:hypothetical protein